MKDMIFKFEGGFRDGEVIDSRDPFQRNQAIRLYRSTKQGTLGRGFVECNPEMLKRDLKEGTYHSHARHEYKCSSKIEDDNLITITLKYSVAKTDFGM